MTSQDKLIAQTTAIIDAPEIADVLTIIGHPEYAGTGDDYAFAFGYLRSRARYVIERLEAAEKRIARLEAAASYAAPAPVAIPDFDDDFDMIREFDAATRADYQAAERGQ